MNAKHPHITNAAQNNCIQICTENRTTSSHITPRSTPWTDKVWQNPP